MARPSRIGAAAGIAGLAAVMAFAAPSPAAEPDGARALPRFASLRADKVNLRAGPGEQYPIEWVLTRKDMPVEIIAAFEHWRKVRDWEGTLGWVHEKMVWSRRDVVVSGGVRGLHVRPDASSPLVARAEPGVIGKLLECQGAWCRIEAHDYAGWVQRSEVWGVYPAEHIP
jgi:SH3-like domain-containing protein